jgi:hypothetical protein
MPLEAKEAQYKGVQSSANYHNVYGIGQREEAVVAAHRAQIGQDSKGDDRGRDEGDGGSRGLVQAQNADHRDLTHGASHANAHTRNGVMAMAMAMVTAVKGVCV